MPSLLFQTLEKGGRSLWQIGNSVLVVSGYFKQDTTATAADKMLKVLEAEAATQKSAI